MKGLHVLKKRWLLCSLVAGYPLLGSEPILSTLKEEQFGFDYRKASLQSDILRDSWLQPVILRYSYSKSDQYDGDGTTENGTVSIDQPIFRSGGIYYGIKFAEASRRYSNLSIDAARQKLIKEAVSLLMQIRQSDLRLAKQELLIANSGLNLELKTESYLHGELDSGFLDNAIIEKNLLTQGLYDMQTLKERLISAYESISDAPYTTTTIPKLSLIEVERFESEAIDLALAQSDINKNRWNANMIRAKYLPQISLNGAYNWNKIENPAFAGSIMPIHAQSRYTTYGVSASMPLDFNEFREMEISRIDVLKSGVMMADKKRELRSLYQQVRHNLANSDKKMALARENQKLYEKLLGDTRELFRAGYKTEYDVNMLANSAKIQEIETQIIDVDRQLELLNLYEKVNGAI
ncbi:TolC family protein [Sulfuricurvum sp.]|uniref:TolC family protein n=1 Tax=Sulfuricurvum sp. TaxID=2025608 RepID=UPI00286EA024|nr:TolC family protein [Sulfuricurvum sp.]